jgi:hypothetical protein
MIMSCTVEFCPNDPTPTLNLCKRHLKIWRKAGEPVGDAFNAWLITQRDEELDVCLTPPELAIAICDLFARRIEPNVTRILEPSAGAGVFVRAARLAWPKSDITAMDIREECRADLEAAGADDVDIRALEDQDICDSRPELVIGNPPFALAEHHIRLLLAAMNKGAYLVFLLRLGFYESNERLDFWNEHPEKFFIPVVPRPGFKLNGKGMAGTDSQAYGIFIWKKGWSGPSTRLPHLVWQKPKLPKGRRTKAAAQQLEIQSGTIVAGAAEIVEPPELET